MQPVESLPARCYLRAWRRDHPSASTPFTGTSLDVTLRSLGIRTVVAMGVSLNIGLTGMVMSAVDLGYGVVAIRDAVAGVPQEYGETVLEHTIAMLANVLVADEVIACWT